MLKVFKDMQSDFDEKELMFYSFRLGIQLEADNEDPQKVLSFANRALKFYEKDDQRYSKLIAMLSYAIGSANYRLNRFADSLEYFNRANRIVVRLAPNNFCDKDFRGMIFSVQDGLFRVKHEIGRTEEAVEHLRKCVELLEELLEKDNREVGFTNLDLAVLYVSELNFKEALPYCLKALEIHKKQLEQNSVDVVCARRILGVIYTGLEDHEKALEQNELSRKVLNNPGQSADLIRVEMLVAEVQIELGNYETAINTLRGVVEMADEDSMTRALVFIPWGERCVTQEKFAESKRCLEIACGLLDKKEAASPVEVAEAYLKISLQYEKMNEFETAISLLKRPVAFLQKLPQEQHSKGKVNAKIGLLLLVSDKVAEAIPHLELAASILKETFGPKHFQVGYTYNNLGRAYLLLDIRHGCISSCSAAQTFAVAKDVLDESLGPHHVDSISACQNLSKAYHTMGSIDLAIEFQQQVIDAMESHGPSAEDKLREAHQWLKQLKKESHDASSNKLPVKVFPLPMHYAS
ncbi:hypothetical protein SLA2020_338730 [Shorea laevis]